MTERDPIIEQLVHDAQATEARMLPAHGELNEHHIAHVRSCLAAHCGKTGKKLEDIAREMRVNPGLLLRLAQADYDPMMDDFARRVDLWLKTIDQPDGTPTEPQQMVSTRVVDTMRAIIKNVCAARAIGIIVGESGTSKTLVLQAAADYWNPGYYMHCVQEASRPGPVIKQLAKAMGVTARYRNGESFMAIVDSLKATPRALYIDQADYLPFKSLNIFRDIHKLTRCPIILCGTQELNDTLNQENALRVQFARLILHRYNINDEAGMDGRPLFSVDEIIAYSREMKLHLTLDAAGEATDIVNIRDFGGLGSLNYLLLNAHTIALAEQRRAKKTGRVFIHPAHIHQALASMNDAASGQRLEQRRQVAAEKRRKVAVA